MYLLHSQKIGLVTPVWKLWFEIWRMAEHHV